MVGRRSRVLHCGFSACSGSSLGAGAGSAAEHRACPTELIPRRCKDTFEDTLPAPCKPGTGNGNRGDGRAKMNSEPGSQSNNQTEFDRASSNLCSNYFLSSALLLHREKKRSLLLLNCFLVFPGPPQHLAQATNPLPTGPRSLHHSP